MYKYKFICLVLLILAITTDSAFAQNGDTIKVKKLDEVNVSTNLFRNSISRLEPISGTYLINGKKNEVISISNIDANIPEKTGRQLFAKVPGVFVYDMEGGNQLNIATRGLDPHRGWEFNLRKDGIITNSDMYAYPASHYSTPMESVDRVELIRGTGSLQYGAQFGGMLNYVSKQGDTSRPISLESVNTVGSYNLLSTYNAISGKVKKVKYYAYYAKRNRDGYRQNEHTDYDAQGICVTISPTKKLTLRLDWARSNYLYKIPGPLSDVMFAQNPRQATRNRNYFNPTINIPSLTVNYDITESTKLQLISSAVLGQRKSVLFDKPATINDTINLTTLQYNNRQVDIDRFNSYTQELRLLKQYKIGSLKNSISAGVQIMNNNLHRTQLGKGTTGVDYDLTLVDPVWGRDINFKTNNVALFAENSFSLLHNLFINAGIRFEKGESKMSGKITYYPENDIPVSIKHNYLLVGGNFSYKPKPTIEIYGGIAQTYRPMLFKDIVPSSTFEKVNPTIKDANGYNLEVGCRGKQNFLQWDVTAFLLKYNNRFGTLALTDAVGNFYTYRTNIGNSITKGVELFLQANFSTHKNVQLIFFTSTSFMDGKYNTGMLKIGNVNAELKGKKIESVPNVITRNGITYQYKKLSVTSLLSYTSQTYADPINTKVPNATGSVGIVPSYFLVDLNFSYRVSKNIEFKGSFNNLLDGSYFTKRPLFYPGPGIWPSDGRSFNISSIVKL